MKKFLLFVFIIFQTLALKAQLDTDHWFAPIAVGNPGSLNDFSANLYLSTNETTPFQVDFYNNSTLFTSVQLVKGNPQKISIPEHMMVVSSSASILTPTTQGLYVKGARKFFANYRFSVTNHAEIITSKGLAGIGNEFFAAMAPITGTASHVNATIGILATEDDTEVTIDNYNPDVIFSNGNTDDILKVTLNKGQSYILDANSRRVPANLAGLLGTHITSTHPISVTNGNFNGIYTYNNLSNNDILMDQAVPVNRLGNEFAVIKGNGTIDTGMEAALIVATEDNTDIYVNGASTPVITLNKGENYMIQSTEYVAHGTNHYNVGIKTSHNVYVYQLLGGTSTGTVYATGGFNYIPPLNCFLPNKIDEIGYIDEIGSTLYNTKLNILSQKGASITVNGNSLNASYGPFPIAGNADWETYSVPNITGNITVISNKSVTAGIAAGNGAVGYGGYFAGFSSIPVITKTGDCFRGTQLQVDDSYDTYQWYFNGAPIAGETNYYINPEVLGSGSYTCKIAKEECGSETTKPYIYTKCPTISEVDYEIGSCEDIIISPKLTASTQILLPEKSRIIVNPMYGTVSINTAGVITYKAHPNLTDNQSDTFVYYVEGSGDPADFEYFRIRISLKTLSVQNATLQACDDGTGKALFNLQSASITSEAGAKIEYFQDSNLSVAIGNPTAYLSPATTIYAKVTSRYHCSATTTIDLKTIPSPNIDSSKYLSSLCDDDFDGKIEVDFNAVTKQIVNQSDQFNVDYYLSQSDAAAGNSAILPATWTYSNQTKVFVRVASKDGNCPPVFGEINFDHKARTPLQSTNITTTVCDLDLNGSENYDFKSVISSLSNNPNVSYTVFRSERDAQNNTNPLTNTMVKDGEIYYLRLADGIHCANIAQVKIQLKSSRKSSTLINQTVCPSLKALVNAGTGYDYYRWSTGEEGTNKEQIKVGPGLYWVELSLNGCVYKQEVEIIAAELPTIESIEVKGNTANVHAKGGTSPLLYSMNGVDWSASSVFTHLERGIHTVYVKSQDNCTPISKNFLIINLINAITPNNDGINDVLDYSDLKIKKDVRITIYDRYGNTQFAAATGTYTWDGKKDGRPIPTGTYWYLLRWTEPDTNLNVSYSDWILVKNRD